MGIIIVSTDFSLSSINAVNYAADFAAEIHAQLIVLNTARAMSKYVEFLGSEEVKDDVLDSNNSELSILVENLKKRTKGTIKVTSANLEGSIESQLERKSRELSPIAIVMDIKSGKTFDRSLMGSLIFHMISHVTCPILIIPEDVKYQTIKQIGFACDLEDIAQFTPIEQLKSWLALCRAKLDIIYVTLNNDKITSSKVEESIFLRTQLKSFHPHFNFVHGISLTTELNEFAHLHKLDLLIVIPKGHGISHLLQHKNSRKVITHNSIPVLAMYNHSGVKL